MLFYIQTRDIVAGTMGSRMRKNKSQRDQRRANLHANLPRLTVDTESGSTHLRHRVDLKTGLYRGRQVLNMDANTTNVESKAVKSEEKSADKKKEVAAK